MKRQVLLLAFLLILLPTTACFAAVTQNDFTVSGVNLLASGETEALTHWGQPKKKKVNEGGVPPLSYLTYPGMHVRTNLATGKIVSVRIDNRDFRTARDVGVGATPYNVRKQYGEPQKEIIRGHSYYIYPLDATGYRLIFDMTDGFVGEIIFSMMPDDP